MPRIFISYRRDDSAGHAGRLYDRLRGHFGPDRVFMDVTGIEAGTDFVETIDEAVGGCDVLIAVIGRQWLQCADERGRRRLEDPHDFICLEVGSALQRKVRVVPVLVEGAAMPATSDLPERLQGLTRRQAVELRDTRWDADVEDLIAALERIPDASAGATPGAAASRPSPSLAPAAPSGPASGMPKVVWALAALAMALGLALYLGRDPDVSESGPPPVADATQAGNSKAAVPQTDTAQPADPGAVASMAGTARPDTAPGLTPAPARSPAKGPATTPAKPAPVAAARPAPTPVVAAKTPDPGPLKAESSAKPVAVAPRPDAKPAAEPEPPRPSAPTAGKPTRAPAPPPVTRRVLVLSWGKPSGRGFWGGIKPQAYSQRMAEHFAKVLRDQLPEGYEVRRVSDEQDARALAIERSAGLFGRLCADGATAWVFAAHVEEPFAISSADSAFWPDLILAGGRCGGGEPVVVRHNLAPRQGEDFPFASDMRDAMRSFVRGQGRLSP